MGETEKHKIFSPERKEKEEGQGMTSPRANSCLKSVKMNWGEVETRKETENSTCMRHIILAVELESRMVIIEAEAMRNVELWAQSQKRKVLEIGNDKAV